jgi:DNA-binding HxlR family transcriptional regulator
MDRSAEFPQSCGSAKDPTAMFGPCATHWLIRQLADRWSLPILSTLQSSPRRFTEMLQILKPVSRRMLDRTLKKLIQIGLVARTGALPQAHYEMTDLGRSLVSPLGRIFEWSQINFATVEALRSRRPPG